MKLKVTSIIAGLVAGTLVTSCGATDAPATSVPVQPTPTSAPPTATPVPPTDTPEPLSCGAAQGNCLELSWDGESCTYEGPAELKAGPVTLLFHNEGEGMAAVNLLRHLSDQSIQDAIDYIGEEPTTKPYPSWSRELGTWASVAPGSTHRWEGVLEPGVHHMVCARLQPIGAWFGGGFTVED
jgi:hypothetical protein